MRNRNFQYVAGLLSLAAFLTASAQETPDALIEEPEIRRYTVEVIIFEYAQEVSTGSEVFIADVPEINELLLEDPVEEDLEIIEEPEPGTEEEPEPLPDTEMVLLAEDDYQLDEVLGHLRRLDVYEPVMHFGWTQATWPEEQTEAIPLFRFEEPPEGLDGSLTLYLSRYLHLVVDLQLDAPQVAMVSRENIERHGDTTVGELLGYMEGEERLPPVKYEIQENRILKNGELRYYDHPKFGVLAMVTRVEDEEEDPETGELLGYGPE